MRLGLVSAKGAPGTTTFALAAAAVSGGVMVEADPAGGDVECWVGPRGEPGLIRLAGALRHSVDLDGVVLEHAVEVRAGVRAVLAPVGAEQAESTLVAIGAHLAPALRATSGWVLVDGGRWSRLQATAPRVQGCDVVAVVMSATLTAAAHAQRLVSALRETVDAPVVAIVVGDRGYRAAELAHAIGVGVVGTVPWDRRAVDTLLASGVSKMWLRSSLARSTRTLIDQQLPALAAGAGVGRD